MPGEYSHKLPSKLRYTNLWEIYWRLCRTRIDKWKGV